MQEWNDLKSDLTREFHRLYIDTQSITIFTEPCVDDEKGGEDEADRGGFEFTGYTRRQQITAEPGGMLVILKHSLHALAAVLYMMWQSWSRPDTLVLLTARVWEDKEGDVYYMIDVVWPESATRTKRNDSPPPPSNPNRFSN